MSIHARCYSCGHYTLAARLLHWCGHLRCSYCVGVLQRAIDPLDDLVPQRPLVDTGKRVSAKRSKAIQAAQNRALKKLRAIEITEMIRDDKRAGGIKPR